MTRSDYDVELLISTLQEFKSVYPHLHVILEPGSALLGKQVHLWLMLLILWKIKVYQTAILDVSFTCHMPDCLEMPYMPVVRNAVIAEEEEAQPEDYRYRYRFWRK